MYLCYLFMLLSGAKRSGPVAGGSRSAVVGVTCTRPPTTSHSLRADTLLVTDLSDVLHPPDTPRTCTTILSVFVLSMSLLVVSLLLRLYNFHVCLCTHYVYFCAGVCCNFLNYLTLTVILSLSYKYDLPPCTRHLFLTLLFAPLLLP